MKIDKDTFLRKFYRIFLLSNYQKVGRIVIIVTYIFGSLLALFIILRNPKIAWKESNIIIHESYWTYLLPLQPLPNSNQGILPDEYPSFGLFWSENDDETGLIKLGSGIMDEKILGIDLKYKKTTPLPSWPNSGEWLRTGKLFPFRIEFKGTFRMVNRRILAGYPIPTKIKTQSFKCFTGDMVIQDQRASGLVSLATITYKDAWADQIFVQVSPKGRYLMFFTLTDPKCPVLYFFRHEEGR